MAALSATTMQGAGQRSGVQNTLTASDTFIFTPGARQMLLLYNPTGGTITPNIKGSDAVNAAIPGLGGAVGAYSSGFNVAVTTLDMDYVNLDDSRYFLTALAGVVTITSGTGLIALLLNY